MATAAPAPETLAPQTPAEAPTPPAGCTFDAGNWAILARHWYPVATLEEVTQGPVKARLLDQP
ncbi:MAG TPA: hypothetical protein VFF94_03200, partial [Novosphingobium sp.]|nr:hypothetical protein [Novosphingobium sp.]